ncbi:MAG: PEP/pyruvate-binding domain-containing protein [Myxococcota bacterium]|nr:PEP/pyruvate-binding domain-containing protein [Myxococcota bacterium]
MAPLTSTITAMMDTSLFKKEQEVRFLLLEGQEDFLKEHAGIEAAAPWATEFISSNLDNVLGYVAINGGLKRMIRDEPMDPETLQALEAALETQFSHLGPTQGLRFRSSSTAEDVEGFNGAGLYDSNTGFLNPELQATETLQKRSVEWALKKTWASYWSFGAFEERRHALIDHMDGRMGVLVHPRFDDPKELANGVITLSVARLPSGTTRQMVVNVQTGAISVTNPDPDNPSTPEIDRVVTTGDETPEVERIQESSEVDKGDVILSDEELLWLFEQLSPLADAWQTQANAEHTEAESRLSLVLDMEFKRMAEGWPETASGEAHPERLVLKQVRTLDQALRVPYYIADLPAPRDILEVIGHIQQRTCAAGPFNLVTTEFYTDPGSSQLLPYDVRPFNAAVSLQVGADIPGMELKEGASIYLLHTETTTLDHPTMTGEDSWDLHVIVDPETAQNTNLTEITVSPDGSWTLSHGDAVAQGEGLTCDVEDLLVGPSLFLEQVLAH